MENPIYSPHGKTSHFVCVCVWGGGVLGKMQSANWITQVVFSRDELGCF